MAAELTAEAYIKAMKHHGSRIQTPQELDSILHDYELQAAELKNCIEKYETEHHPIHGAGIWLCPVCRHKINEMHDHCHRCGAKVGWIELQKQRKKESEIRGKKNKRR